MINFDAPVDVLLKKFWSWWIGELSCIVPPSVRTLIGHHQDLLLLEVDRHELRLIHRTDHTEHPLASYPREATPFAKREDFLAEHPKLRETRVALRLAPHQGLRRTLKLPLAAEENLNQVIGIEMDRISPFKRDQVYFSARVVERFKATRQLAVQLTLTPRVPLDEILDQLHSAGWMPAFAFLQGDEKPGEFNLLPDRFKPKSNQVLDYLNIFLLSVAMASLILALCLPAWLVRSEVVKVQSELRKASKSAKEVEALREQADKLLHQAQVLQTKKRSEPILVDALEELTRVIPDDTWLNGLQYSNHRVVIQGQSPSASQLLKQIEGSGYFKDVSFVSPVTKDAGNGLERFQIAFELINGRFSEEAH